ncbi:MAG: class I SAM-dependent methyltransferase [Candidatus Latescibacterota bacterium]|jgi:SAM-dependent methyltransferase
MTQPSTGTSPEPCCRFCGAPLTVTFVDLGMSPLSNAYVPPERVREMEPFYPLHARVCGSCFLVQLEEFASPQSIFGEYAYFSSYSETWLEHARHFAAGIVARLGLGPASLVLEVASNDGYLLQHVQRLGIPVLGIEPAANVAAAALAKGIPTETVFFGTETARRLVGEDRTADLIVANNVLAHVPDLNDFVAGMALVLKRSGTITVEFPHLLRLMAEGQFDTIYHEHFSYFSLLTATRVLARHGLEVHDVEELSTHGGSLRLYARHAGLGLGPVDGRVAALLERERSEGLDRLDRYLGFETKVQKVKRDLLRFLIEAREGGKRVAGYGAPAKGNTLLNYCGIRTDLLAYTVDRNPVKQGTLLPGTRIPVRDPARLRCDRPDFLLVLPWNLIEEIVDQHRYIREWGGRFVVPIPALAVR